MRAAPIEALAEGLRSGPRPVAVLAGAGVSQTAGMAAGEDLLRMSAAERGEEDHRDRREPKVGAQMGRSAQQRQQRAQRPVEVVGHGPAGDGVVNGHRADERN